MGRVFSSQRPLKSLKNHFPSNFPPLTGPRHFVHLIYYCLLIVNVRARPQALISLNRIQLIAYTTLITGYSIIFSPLFHLAHMNQFASIGRRRRNTGWDWVGCSKSPCGLRGHWPVHCAFSSRNCADKRAEQNPLICVAPGFDNFVVWRPSINIELENSLSALRKNKNKKILPRVKLR